MEEEVVMEVSFPERRGVNAERSGSAFWRMIWIFEVCQLVFLKELGLWLLLLGLRSRIWRRCLTAYLLHSGSNV